jgi:hypothetical protein
MSNLMGSVVADVATDRRYVEKERMLLGAITMKFLKKRLKK